MTLDDPLNHVDLNRPPEVEDNAEQEFLESHHVIGKKRENTLVSFVEFLIKINFY